MSRKIVLELFFIVSVAMFWIPGALAYPQYLEAYNSTFSTNASCGICHVNAAGGGPRNSYGMQFENQTNHVTDPVAALTSIGRTSLITPGATTTATSRVTATLTVTSTATTTVTSTATSIATEPPLIAAPTETQIPVETPINTIPEPTQSTPGFGPWFFITGLIACYFILKWRNNN
jgi:hypothetical protein